MTNIITGLLITITAANFQPVSVTKALPERADGEGDVYVESAPISTNVFIQFPYTNHQGIVVTWKREVDFIESTNIVSRYRTNQGNTSALLPLFPLPNSTTVSTKPPTP